MDRLHVSSQLDDAGIATVIENEVQEITEIAPNADVGYDLACLGWIFDITDKPPPAKRNPQ